jgi:hypothetical protein
MADTPANATAEAEQQTQQAPDPKDIRIQELEAAVASGTNNYKALQRNLDRTRTQLEQSNQLTGKVSSLEQTLGVMMEVVAANPDLDESVKAKLSTHGKERQTQEQAAQFHRQQATDIANIVAEAGVTEWEDGRMEEVLECMKYGDFAGARREARSIVRAEKAKASQAGAPSPATTDSPATKSGKFTPTQQSEIDAEVERQLRAKGVRTVDDGKAKGAGPANGGGFNKTNLGEKLGSMSRADILKNLGAINEAAR